MDSLSAASGNATKLKTGGSRGLTLLQTLFRHSEKIMSIKITNDFLERLFRSDAASEGDVLKLRKLRDGWEIVFERATVDLTLDDSDEASELGSPPVRKKAAKEVSAKTTFIKQEPGTTPLCVDMVRMSIPDATNAARAKKSAPPSSADEKPAAKKPAARGKKKGGQGKGKKGKPSVFPSEFDDLAKVLGGTHDGAARLFSDS